MTSSVSAWVIAHKEWCFTVLCAICGGVFALLKWIWPMMKHNEKLKSGNGDSFAINGSGNTVAAVARGATVHGGVIAGSNNVQTVVINHNSHQAETPIRERKPSTPTGNEIRQRKDAVLKGVPLVMQHEVLQKYLKGFVNLSVAWPIKVHGVYSKLGSETLTVDARYGEESWGAYIRFKVPKSDFPILNTLEDGHGAFVEGRICEIDDHLIEIEVAKLEFE
jgi:hypothetical protein